MLEDVKNYLRITWDDEDPEILSLIERGRRYLERKTGTSLDFDSEDLPRQLLFDYCRYARNNSMEFYGENFASDILHLTLSEAIKEKRDRSES